MGKPKLGVLTQTQLILEVVGAVEALGQKRGHTGGDQRRDWPGPAWGENSSDVPKESKATQYIKSLL